MLNKKILGATASAPALYPEDVYSTYLYTGNGSTQTITNGIDLAGEGGLVWIKRRDGANGHFLVDSARGITQGLGSNSTVAQFTDTDGITSFNANGFSIGASYNTNAATYVSWSFRKQPKFFDVTTATQTTGNTGWLTFNHNLGSVPGMIIIKVTSTADNWFVYHRSTSTSTLFLNLTNAASGVVVCQNVTSTSFEFNLSNYGSGNGATYVAYLFAHDAGGFGTAGTDNVISCGSYTGNGSATGPVIDLGYEPQYVLIKQTSASGQGWAIRDIMRGIPTGYDDAGLTANTSNAEVTNFDALDLNATGFQLRTADGAVNASGATYIYMAIRRPMKVPTTGTEVFNAVGSLGSTGSLVNIGFPIDLIIQRYRDGSDDTESASRLAGLSTTESASSQTLRTNSTSAESTSTSALFNNFTNVGFSVGSSYASTNTVPWCFRRATGFFDVVCYTGTGSARTVTHNLGVAPELMIVKNRNEGFSWAVYAAPLGNTKYLVLDLPDGEFTGSAVWNDTSPTASVFTVGTSAAMNKSGNTQVAYLFATCAGVSKVFSYTGNGSSQTINCGFTGGARLVLIKRTDSTGDWYIWDSARGIVSGNDPRLSLNSTAAEVTSDDTIDPDSSGFVVNQVSATNVNVSSATYIGLAIA